MDITELDLSKNGEKGALQPPEWGMLSCFFPFVIKLGLQENQLKSIDTEKLVCMYPKLQILHLSRNSLSDNGEIFLLEKLLELRELDLRENPKLSLLTRSFQSQLKMLFLHKDELKKSFSVGGRERKPESFIP